MCSLFSKLLAIVFSAIGPSIIKTIASSLENKEHILVLEFTGADIAHSVDSPRGWIRKTTSASNPYSSYETFVYTTISDATDLYSIVLKYLYCCVLVSIQMYRHK
jgi:hypothetical protein